MKDIVLVCNDLFGLEIYSILIQINEWNKKRGLEPRYNIIGYISDVERPFGIVSHNVKRLGTVQDWSRISDEKYVLGIQMPQEKIEAADKLLNAGCYFETVVSPWTLMLEVEIGEGSIVSAYSIKPGMKIGRYVTLIESMLTSHHVDDYSTVLCFSNITGDVGTRTFVGNHVYTHLGKTIGNDCYVADGSIVVKTVKDGTCVSGVPAKKVK